MKQRPVIALIPRPPKQGGTASVCYTGGPLPQVLKLDWLPAGLEPDEAECPEIGGCVLIRVPVNAVAVVISDPSGKARSLSTSILPGDTR